MGVYGSTVIGTSDLDSFSALEVAVCVNPAQKLKCGNP